MSKKVKILFILMICAFALLVYLVVSSQPVDLGEPAENRGAGDISREIDLEEIRDNYRKNAKTVFIELERVVQAVYHDSTATSGESDPAATSTGDKSLIFSLTEEIEPLRDQLMSLSVPEEYKELHLEMVIFMDTIENSLAEDNIAGEPQDLQFLGKIKSDYPWLES